MAATENDVSLKFIHTYKVQYLGALYKLGETLPPFSEQRRAIREHIAMVQIAHKKLMKELT